jgi:hypothetical protein
MPTTPLQCLPLCDLIDFVARLRAAEAIIALLAANGLEIDHHAEAVNVLCNYEQLLEHEATRRMQTMEHERSKRGSQKL